MERESGSEKRGEKMGRESEEKSRERGVRKWGEKAWKESRE